MNLGFLAPEADLERAYSRSGGHHELTLSPHNGRSPCALDMNSAIKTIAFTASSAPAMTAAFLGLVPHPWHDVTPRSRRTRSTDSTNAAAALSRSPHAALAGSPPPAFSLSLSLSLSLSRYGVRPWWCRRCRWKEVPRTSCFPDDPTRDGCPIVGGGGGQERLLVKMRMPRWRRSCGEDEVWAWVWVGVLGPILWWEWVLG